MFIGTALWMRAAGEFEFGSWIASPMDDVAHTHEDAHFMFIAAGRFLTGRRPSAASIPLIFNPAGTTHRDRFESPRGRFFSVSIAAEFDGAPAMTRLIDNLASHTLTARLIRECTSWDSDSPQIAEALGWELLSTIATTRGERAAPRWLSRVTAIIAEGPPVALSQISREIGIHRTHLTRTFRRFHGCTPAEFGRLARLRRAAAVLASTGMPLAQVAVESGFADQSHFTKHFRAAYGVPPGEYRRLTLLSHKTRDCPSAMLTPCESESFLPA